jgi:hypothetical protein
MIVFTEIVSKEFQGTPVSKIILTLEKHTFYPYVEKVISEINELILQNKANQYLFQKIAGIGASTLVKINETFRNKPINKKDKSNLENILGCIFKRLTISILNHIEPKDRPIVFELIKEEVELQCKLNDYNIDELGRFINFKSLAIDIMIEFTPITKESEIVIPHLILKGHYKENPIKFFENVRSLKCFNNDSFTDLFSKPDRKLNLEFNPKNIYQTRQFLTWLNISSIVSSSPSNIKFYDTFRFHSLNFELIVPKDKKVKYIMDGARRLTSWPENSELFEKLFKP